MDKLLNVNMEKMLYEVKPSPFGFKGFINHFIIQELEPFLKICKTIFNLSVLVANKFCSGSVESGSSQTWQSLLSASPTVISGTL